MLATLLSILLSTQPVSPAPAELRTVTFSVVAEDGTPVRGLTVEEVAILENGLVRDISKLEADRQPLSLAVIVDSSEAMGSGYRLNVVDAVGRFLGRLPEGTRYAIWTSGDRPRKLVDLTDDALRASAALRRVPTSGGNTLLDAIVEASRDLKKVE